MNASIRDRIVRHLEPLSDERGYQVLDYIEFLESKYAAGVAPPPSLFQRFTEGVEDTLRAGRVSASAISEAVGLLNKAAGVLGGVAAAGKSVATDIAAAGKTVASDIAAVATRAAEVAGAPASAPGTSPAAPSTPAAEDQGSPLPGSDPAAETG